MVMESGYTQQKVQPWRRRDVRRSRVKGRGQGTPLCVLIPPAQGSGQYARRTHRDPHRPSHRHGWAEGSGLMFIGRMAAGPCVRSCLWALMKGLKVRPYPSERRPSVSRADGGNEGHRYQMCWRGSCYRLHSSC